MSMTVNQALSSMWISPSFALKGYPVHQVGQLTVGEAPDPPKHFILDGVEYRRIRRETQHSECAQKSHQRSIPHQGHLCERNNKGNLPTAQYLNLFICDKWTFHLSCYSYSLSWLPENLQSLACSQSADPAEFLRRPSRWSAGSAGPGT